MNSTKPTPQVSSSFTELQDNEDTIDLLHYWRVLLRFKWSILGFGAFTAVIAAMVTFTTANIYESSATLLIESTTPKITSIEQIYGLESQSKDYFATQFELLKNRNLAERVIKDLKLLDNPEFAPDENSFNLKAFIKGLIPTSGSKQVSSTGATPEQIRLASVLETFTQNLTISPIRNTELVKVSFESTDPQLAATVANRLSNAYIESHLEQRVSSTEQASVWMQGRLVGLKDALETSEAKLQNFLERERLVDIKGVESLNVQELDELTTQNNKARQVRAESETIFRQVQQFRTAAMNELLTLPAVLSHPILAKARENLDSIEQQIADLSQRYGRNHPRMVALRSQQDEAHRVLERQLKQVVGSIENDYRTAVDNERVAQERMEKAIGEFQGVNRKGFELKELQREVDTNRQLYDMFFTRLRETDQTDDFQATPAIIIDPAVPAINPSKPRRSLITMIALFAGLMLGVMLAFMRDMLDNTIHSPDDIESKLGSTTLGVIPINTKVKSASKKQKNDKMAHLGFIEDPQSSFSESFRTIRTSLMLSSLDKPYKTIAITSSVPNEGKTTVSINLALVMGQMKKTILIGADMRRPSLAKSLGLAANSPGLSHLMAGTEELKACVYTYKDSQLAYIPSGQIVANPLEILSSAKFKALLAKLGGSYEQIIIDTPPTQAVSDALVVSSLCDATIYVVNADETPIKAIKNGLNRLQASSAKLAGVILNQVDTEKQSSYYYYGGYYDSYGYSSKDEKPIPVS